MRATQLEIYEESSTCIHSTLALMNVLKALEISARPLRVEAKVLNLSITRHR